MGSRNIENAAGGGAGLVEKIIGNAYPVVKAVYDDLANIDAVNALSTGNILTEVLAVPAAVQTLLDEATAEAGVSTTQAGIATAAAEQATTDANNAAIQATNATNEAALAQAAAATAAGFASGTISVMAGALAGTGLSGTSGLLMVKYGNVAGTALQGNDPLILNAVQKAIDGTLSNVTVGPNLPAYKTYAALLAMPAIQISLLVDGQTISINEFLAGTGLGGGKFAWRAALTATPVTGLVVCPTFNATPYLNEAKAAGTGAASYTATTAHINVVPGTVQITAAGITGIITDDTYGNLISNGLPVGTINYGTGVNVINLVITGAVTITYSAAQNGRWVRLFYGQVDALFCGAGAGVADNGPPCQTAVSYAGLTYQRFFLGSVPGTLNFRSSVTFGCSHAECAPGNQIKYNPYAGYADLTSLFYTNYQEMEVIGFHVLGSISYSTATLISGGIIDGNAWGDISLYQTKHPYTAIAVGYCAFQTLAKTVFRDCSGDQVKFGLVINHYSGHDSAYECSWGEYNSISGVWVAQNGMDYMLVGGTIGGALAGLLYNDDNLTGNAGFSGTLLRVHFYGTPYAALQVTLGAGGGINGLQATRFVACTFEQIGEAIVRQCYTSNWVCSILEPNLQPASAGAAQYRLPYSAAGSASTFIASQGIGLYAFWIGVFVSFDVIGALPSSWTTINPAGKVVHIASTGVGKPPTNAFFEFTNGNFTLLDGGSSGRVDFSWFGTDRLLQMAELRNTTALRGVPNLLAFPETIGNWNLSGTGTGIAITNWAAASAAGQPLNGFTLPPRALKEYGPNPPLIVISAGSAMPSVSLNLLGQPVAPMASGAPLYLNGWVASIINTAGVITQGPTMYGRVNMTGGGSLFGVPVYSTLNSFSSLAKGGGVPTLNLTNFQLYPQSYVANHVYYIIPPMLSWNNYAPYNPFSMGDAVLGLTVGDPTGNLPVASQPNMISDPQGNLIFSASLGDGSLKRVLPTAAGNYVTPQLTKSVFFTNTASVAGFGITPPLPPTSLLNNTIQVDYYFTGPLTGVVWTMPAGTTLAGTALPTTIAANNKVTLQYFPTNATTGVWMHVIVV